MKECQNLITIFETNAKIPIFNPKIKMAQNVTSSFHKILHKTIKLNNFPLSKPSHSSLEFLIKLFEPITKLAPAELTSF